MQKNNQEAAVVAINQAELDKVALDDFRNALLIVSIFVNLVVLILWIILQVTTQHDYEIARLLFVR